MGWAYAGATITDASRITTGILANANGGTGLNTSSAANGALLIGTGTGFALNQITGTVNRVTVTNGSGTITLTAPQDIHTGAVPTFAGLTLTGPLTGKKATFAYAGSNGDPMLLVTDASSNLFFSVYANGSGHTMIRNGVISFELQNSQAAWLLNSDGFGYFASGVALRDTSGNPTSKLTSNGVGIVALSNTTNPTALRVFNTTDSTSAPINAEWLETSWASNIATITTAKAGTGALRTLNITSAGSAAMTITSNGSQTDFSQAGTKLTMHSAGFFLSTAQAIGWSTHASSPFSGTIDLSIYKVGTGILGLAQNASGGVGELRIFGTTDSVSGAPTNSEYLRLYYDGSFNTITSGKTGTGSLRTLRITGGSDLLIGGAPGREVTFYDGVNTPLVAMRAGPSGGLGALSMHATSAWLQWGSAAYNSTGDLYLVRPGVAGTLGVHNSTNPAGLRIYNTTDILTTTVAGGAPTDAEWLETAWSSNICTIQTAKSGAGTARALKFNGTSLTLQTGGNARWQVDANGHLLATTDVSWDIGQSGATRPRFIYANGFAAAGVAGAGGEIRLGNGASVGDLRFQVGFMQIGSDFRIQWSATHPYVATEFDLSRVGTRTLGVSAGTSAVALRIFNTTDSATSPVNAEWLETAWSSNVCTLKTNKSGTGTLRELAVKGGTKLDLGYGATTRASIDSVGINLLGGVAYVGFAGGGYTYYDPNLAGVSAQYFYASAGAVPGPAVIRVGDGVNLAAPYGVTWWSASDLASGSADLVAYRVSSGVLGLAKNATGNSAALRVFNTTDSVTGAPTNAEWLEAAWASNICTIQTAKSGSGTARLLKLAGVSRISADGVGGSITLDLTGGGGIIPDTNIVRDFGSPFVAWLGVHTKTVEFSQAGAGLRITQGSGSPEGVVTADVGSLYLNRTGGVGTALYVKETGSGNTGWAAK